MDEIWEYVRVYNIIPFRYCQSLINEYTDDDQWQKHFWYNGSNSTQHKEKELDIRFSTASSDLNPYIRQAISEYCSDVNIQKETITEWTSPRLNRYSEGTKMRDHVDLIRRHKRDGVPVLSVLGLMNDDFEGGGLDVRGSIIEAKKGRIVIFPSFAAHKVLQFSKKDRYTLITFAEGNTFK